MPELPEVETVKRTLEPDLIEQKITGVRVLYGGIIKIPAPEQFAQELIGRIFQGIRRRGKYLVFSLSGNLNLVIHLRMTGQLVVCENTKPLDKHTHLVFQLDNGRELRFTDIRKFGLVYLVGEGCYEDIGGLYNLGPEPLEEEFTLQGLRESLQKKGKTRLKAFLLDQSQVAGIGNIYADEILFAAGLHPERRAGCLQPHEEDRLYAAIRSRLQESVNLRGTTIRDYVDGRGEKGRFQEKLKVYGRGGQRCHCGSLLEKIIVAGRTTVFCPKCQV